MTAIPSDTREELVKLERKHAENPEGRYFVPLASAYRKNGEIDKAVALLRDGLERHPEYLSAHIVLGRCLADQGESAAAETEFTYVLSLDPQNLIALRTLGEMALAADRLDQARVWYEDLLDVDPMNEEARRSLEMIKGRLASPEAESADAGSDSDGIDDSLAPAASEETVVAAEVTPEAAAARNDFENFLSPLNAPHSEEDEGAVFGNAADSVVTETIADLYARQGFYDRAIDVYRELIRRRGGDSGLEEKLRDVEQMLTDSRVKPGSVPAADAESPSMEPSVFADQPEQATAAEAPTGGEVAAPSELYADPFADSFATGFPSILEAAETDDVEEFAIVEAGGGQSASESGEGVTIRAFLRSVLAWTPMAATNGKSVSAQSLAETTPGAASAWALQSQSPDVFYDPIEREEASESAGIDLSGNSWETGFHDASSGMELHGAEAGGDELGDTTSAEPSDEPWMTDSPGEISLPEGPPTHFSMENPDAAEAMDAFDEPWALGSAKESIVLESFPGRSAMPSTEWNAPTWTMDPEAEGADVSRAEISSLADLEEEDQGEETEAIPASSSHPDDYLFPWEMDQSPDLSTQPSDSEANFSEDRSDVDDVGQIASADEPAAELSLQSVPPQEEVSPVGNSEASSTTTPPGSTRDEDHDLESFQAWLRSLKR